LVSIPERHLLHGRFLQSKPGWGEGGAEAPRCQNAVLSKGSSFVSTQAAAMFCQTAAPAIP
jgi:hypothetical protein